MRDGREEENRGEKLSDFHDNSKAGLLGAALCSVLGAGVWECNPSMPALPTRGLRLCQGPCSQGLLSPEQVCASVPCMTVHVCLCTPVFLCMLVCICMYDYVPPCVPMCPCACVYVYMYV